MAAPQYHHHHSPSNGPGWSALLRRMRKTPGVVLLVALGLIVLAHRRWSASSSSSLDYVNDLSATRGQSSTGTAADTLRWVRRKASSRRRRPRVAFFTVPKPFSGAARKQQRRALYSWKHLTGIEASVRLVPSQDSDLAELKSMADEVDASLADVRWDPYGAVMQDELFVAASRASDADLVVVLNSDIVLFEDFSRVIVRALDEFLDNFFLVAARYEVSDSDDGAEENEFLRPEYYRTLFEQRSTSSTLHTYGGVDIYVWRPGGDPYERAIGGSIPPFTYGRGKADNWVLRQAYVNGVPTIDVSLAVKSLHFAHGYDGGKTAVQVNDKGQVQFTDHWHSATGPSVDMNRFSFFLYGSVELQRGTPWETRWKISLCTRRGEDELCMQERVGEWCPCEYNPLVKSTLSPLQIHGNLKVCATLSPPEGYRRPEEEDGALLMAQWRARDGALVLVGVTESDVDILGHTACRFHQLDVDNFLLVAMDKTALTFCRKAAYPCVAAADLASASSTSPLAVREQREVLRFLDAGYHITWSSVDSFWLRDVRTTLQSDQYAKYDFVVPRIESSPTLSTPSNQLPPLYFVRRSKSSIEALQSLVKSATSSSTPSLVTLLCDTAPSAAAVECRNSRLKVGTALLPASELAGLPLGDGTSVRWPRQTPKGRDLVYDVGQGPAARLESYRQAGLDLFEAGHGCKGFL